MAQFLIQHALLLRMELEDDLEQAELGTAEGEAIAASLARRDELMRRAGMPVRS